MFLHRWVLLLSLVIGLLGLAGTARSLREYRDAARAYSAVEARVVPGTLTWLDDETARVEVVIANDSPRTATVEHLELHLDADGRFAGSDYRPWRPLAISSGGEQQLEALLSVTTPELRGVAREAELALRGRIRLRFDGIERPLTLDLRLPLERAGG